MQRRALSKVNSFERAINSEHGNYLIRVIFFVSIKFPAFIW